MPDCNKIPEPESLVDFIASGAAEEAAELLEQRQTLQQALASESTPHERLLELMKWWSSAQLTWSDGDWCLEVGDIVDEAPQSITGTPPTAYEYSYTNHVFSGPLDEIVAAAQALKDKERSRAPQSPA